METVCQTELSPELCSRLAENTLIIKKEIVGRAQKPLMAKTLSLTFKRSKSLGKHGKKLLG